MLYESEVEVAVQEMSSAQQPKPRFKTAKVI